eukprot:6470485-Prymnesium_polylepis.2
MGGGGEGGCGGGYGGRLGSGGGGGNAGGGCRWHMPKEELWRKQTNVSGQQRFWPDGIPTRFSNSASPMQWPNALTPGS